MVQWPWLPTLVASLFALVSLCLAIPAINPANPILIGNSLWSTFGAGRHDVSLAGNATQFPAEIRQFEYMVPRTSPPLILTFLLNFDVRIERAALGRTLLNGLQLLRTLVAVKGDEYLEPDDDPWEIDDKLSGKCYAGVATYDQPKSPQHRMKYRTALEAFQGCFDVLFLGRREFGARFMIREGNIGVGHGIVNIGSYPDHDSS